MRSLIPNSFCRSVDDGRLKPCRGRNKQKQLIVPQANEWRSHSQYIHLGFGFVPITSPRKA
jgi:hypothetical protein